MKKLLAALFYLGFVAQASATISCSLPFTLTNGTTADATQVMANYNALVTCFTNAASAGANNDITSLSALITPIGPGVGGSTTFIGGTSGGSANAQTVAATTPTGFALTQGWTVIFKAGFTNSGAMQLNVNSQGLTNVYKATAAGPAALTGGEVFSGQLVIATYDGTEFLITPFPLAGWGILSGAGGLQLNTTNPPLGFDGCSNLSITASATASTLVLTFNGNNGATPSATNPILCAFRDATIANGDPVWVTATAALSINTNAAGATLGSTNSVPFRFWIVMFNNSGTLVPGIINASTSTPSTKIFSLDEGTPQTSVPVSAAATSAGVYYTPNGTTVTAGAFRIVGYLEYSSGLATAGTYSSAPTKVQLFGPGIKKPGDVVQTVFNSTTVTGTTSSATFAALSSGQSQAITPTSTINFIRVSAKGIMQGSANTQNSALQLARGSTLIGIPTAANFEPTNAMNFFQVALDAYDQPNAITSQTYGFQGKTTSGVLSYPLSTTYTVGATLELKEIMN